MNFFNIGWEELLLIMVIAVIFLGPDRLPVAMRAIARGIRNLRRWTADLQAEFNMITQELTSELDELRQVTREIQDELRGVQAELASEMQGMTDTLRQETEAAVAAASGQAIGWSNGASSEGGPSGSTSEVASNGSGPTMASKADPTVDVALFDSEEPVVMPRSERLNWPPPSTNGHARAVAAEATVAVIATPARPPRRGRAAAAAYLRSRRRSAGSDVD